jgi:alkaline phosphatase D
MLEILGMGTAGLIVGCGDNEPPPDPGSTHAGVILEPESDSFLVALWSSAARAAAIDVQSQDGIVTSATADLGRVPGSGTAAVDITGLEPGRSYQVELLFDSGVRLVHHVRTAPRPDDERPVRIAVSADIDPFPEFESEIFTHLAAASPELFVSLGDFPYADNGPPAMTVEEFRARHVETRTAPRIRTWLQTMGLRAIYDDHEFRNDWDAMYRTVEASRYAAAMQVWDEFFPVRAPQGEIRYRSWRWGKNLECFLLDCRRFRSANAILDGDAKTMLGDLQRAWLIEGLARSTATFKLVFTSVPLDYGEGNDHWAGFATEREKILDAIAGVPGVLFVSADQHFFAAHRHSHGVRELQVGPLARGLGTPVAIAPGVLFRSVRYNFGLVDVDRESLTFSGVDAEGTVFYKETLTAQDLTPTPRRR